MSAWAWAQLLYVPVFLYALVAWCRREGEGPLTGVAVAVVFLGLSAFAGTL
jgi:hypothetical protein